MNIPAHPPYTIAMIGYGKMGSALHQGWESADFPAKFHIISPSQTRRTKQSTNYYNTIEGDEGIHSALTTCNAIIMAVKPQMMKEVCLQIQPHVPQNCSIISIAAGQSLKTFESYFNEDQPIIRTMPNTPSAIGQGVTAYIGNEACKVEHLSLCRHLFEISGKAYHVDQEALIDTISAISGSGPAYVFYFIEMLAKAGENAGLEPETAQELARQTVIGSANLAAHNADTPPETLRENVTSPGGTTAEALKLMMDGRWQDICNEAILAAIARAKELS